MGVQSRIAQLGMAKQSAKGTAATAPTYVVGVTGGNVFDVTISQKELDTSWSTRGVEGYDRESAVSAVKADLVAMPSTLGMLLLAACGADAVTGSGPYVHTITPANSLPWMTFFGLYGADKYLMSDSKVDELELTWNTTGALALKLTTMGDAIVFASTWTGGTNERVGGGLLKGVGGTFNVNGSAARVESGSIKISNKLVPVIASYSTTPDDMFESQISCTTSVVLVPDDMTLFRAAVTGTTTGTTVLSTATSGALDLLFKIDASHSVEFTANNVAYTVGAPSVSPAGGPAKLTMAGDCVITSGGSVPFTFVVTNSIATY